jgi:hypothetical protein
MGEFVGGNFDRILLDRWRAERHDCRSRLRNHLPGCPRAGGIAGGQPRPVNRAQIVLRLEVFEVEGEVEDVSVGDRLPCDGRRQFRCAEHSCANRGEPGVRHEPPPASHPCNGRQLFFNDVACHGQVS